MHFFNHLVEHLPLLFDGIETFYRLHTGAMGMDVTMKGMGRQKMDELAVYEVKDGKIVKEQFFF